MLATSKPLHCLQYLDDLSLEKGGTVRSVLDLSAVLAEAGARVTLVSGDTSDAPDEWCADERPGLPRVVRIERKPNLLGKSASQAEVDRLVSEADVLHLHTPWDPFNLAFASAAKRHNRPYLVTAHGMLDDWCVRSRRVKKAVYLSLFGRSFLERSAGIHYTASIEREQSNPRAPLSDSHVLPLIVDLKPFESLPGPELAQETYPHAYASDSAKILFVGRLHPIKGLDLLLDAFAAAEADEPKPHLLLAGPADESYQRELLGRIDRLGVGDRVHLLGMIHGDLKHSLYQSCDAFVLPSHHENFGIALAEAMICGAPALLTKGVNIWPEIERLGGIVAERTVPGLATGIERVAKERKELRQIGQANRSAVLEWLDPQRLASEYLGLYQRLIQSH